MTRLAAALLCLAAAPASAQQQAVTVGFRTDAPPFSAQAADGVGYTGFLVDLCDGALAYAGLEVMRVAVSAADRFDHLDRSASDGGVDMLCDPMSITPERAKTYLLSPQVFATGVGFLRQQGPPPTGPDGVTPIRVGFLGGTTAVTAVSIARARGVLDLLDGGVVDLDTSDLDITTHDEGVAAVCSGALWFYFGDLDILKAIQARAESRGVDCSNVQTSAEVYSYEAYSLPVSAERPDLAIALQDGLYRMFSDPKIYRSYDDHFGQQPRSPILQAVFSLNGVYPPPQRN